MQDRARHGERALRVVEPPPEASIDRRLHLRRIRYLADAYRLQWLVDQESWQAGTPSRLDDHELVTLLRVLERAIEGEQDDVPHIKAGVYRAVAL